MMMDQNATDLISQIFFPYATDRKEMVQQMGGKFAYYTSADTAIRILQNGEIWMRNTSIMNDYMEVKHGVSCLQNAYRGDAGKAFGAALDACHAGLSSEVNNLFQAWIPGIVRDTFVTCFSEHSPDEDEHGRLSMWRAYGGQAGVALIFNSGPIFRPSHVLSAYSSPVGYFNQQHIDAQLVEITRRITEHSSLVRSIERQVVHTTVFNAFRFASVCTKHPAFKEEREWRAVASPSMYASSVLKSEVEIIGAIPQHVLKIPLADNKELGLYGLEPAEFVDRVLIGPCEHPEVIQRALYQR